MTKIATFPLPGIKHGKRILVSTIEERAKNDPDSSWVSMPIDNNDLSKGYKEITFAEFNNAVNHAVHWLRQNLPESDEPFQSFAYAGPKDLRYPILAAAAGKLQKVMVLPSPLIPPAAQRLILKKTQCNVYIRPSSMAQVVGAILEDAPHIQQITAPEPDSLLQETPAEPYVYPKSWGEGKKDPWLVAHTSGTTGSPKPITYTHQMMAALDVAASLPDIDEFLLHHAPGRRWYTPLPSLHLVGMMMVLSMPTYAHGTLVVGPPAPPSADTVVDIFKYGRVDSALLTPALIDEMCLNDRALSALISLRLVSYGGAPLSRKSGDLLAPYVQLVPAIGSTEAGGYFTKFRRDDKDWDYIEFQKQAGAVFEPRSGDLHELVFVRVPECKMQQIFLLYPDHDRFETKDLWIEHPTRKGLWKIVGRVDDYIPLSHADGLYAASLEPEIEQHPKVKAALIGGHGRPLPVLLVELQDETEVASDAGRKAMFESLQPYIDKVNEHCHECVKLSSERLIFASGDRPFIRTVKGSVARMPSLELYKEEIAALFEKN
ncbi:putative AMP-binding enzyme [Aspergillus fischeri NRRL 181]|uniref:AMP-binding enzyme, putative n=1 Tax=Neosartorya fischeri (strain ATCC 1020 / DSM 3700 / CBS 544.65 / FGSC A1164 / JCM 1740 / NRRL 181 / WB 181) TaxID=331117 RepID=A1D5B6_NEOFI|nr:AMP-binding enzyme, putative [Aspergillus fischeri NRRL 181]EAW23609.1 AMP-binding enzyme, putative [Aspergillus fischeri NRRL 181]